MDDSPPQPSPVGAPTGAPVTKAIGAAGGSLASADGKMTVTIPAGAVAADTTVGIQPIENTAAAGLGAAYRLSPAGQTFAQPVTLSFPYTDQDLNGTFAEALGIAFQDAAGRWEWQDNVALDTTLKTLTVKSTHFTDWSKVPGTQLRPPNATVKLKGTVTLTVMSCTKPSGKVRYIRFKCGDPADDLAPLIAVVPDSWAVDGAPGGTTGHGLVAGRGLVGVYTAPATKPVSSGRSTVAVSVKVKHVTGTVLISSEITILTGYHVVGTFTQKSSPLVCAGSISANVTDKVSLDLTLTGDNKYTVAGLTNFATTATAPVVPIVGIAAVVKKKAEIFNAKKGEANLLSDSDLISVALDGDETVGVCSYGPIDSTGETTGVTIGVSFHTSNFFDSGVQKDLPSDITGQDWRWTVTEQ